MDIDLIVVGDGAGGMACALVAANEQLRVLVLEKTSLVGGSCALSAGVCWVPNSHYDKAKTDSVAQALVYLREVIGPTMDRQGLESYLLHAPEAFAHFDSCGVSFAPGLWPDYFPEAPGASRAGRALAPCEFDGRTLGPAFANLRPPPREFMALGGMMVTAVEAEILMRRFKSLAAVRKSVSLFARYLSDRFLYPRGTRLVNGNALAGRLYKGLLDRNVPIWRNTAAVGLVTDQGHIVGVDYDRAGERGRVRARHGVVLATGGFPRNARMRSEWMSQGAPVYSAAPEGNSGDGISMAIEHGAATGDRPETLAFWSPVTPVHRKSGETFNFPHLAMGRAKPGLVAINLNGRRFVNEGTNYHNFGLAMLAQRETTGHSSAYLVCDSQFMARYAIGWIYPNRALRNRMVKEGYLLASFDLKILARKMEVPGEVFAQTIQTYNKYAREGRDPEFGKGDSLYNRFLGDGAHAPNPCLAELSQPPFYAMRVEVGDIGTSHGLAVDATGQVLGAQRDAIRGLYACGNDVNTLMGGQYPGAGITLGPALTQAYLIAKKVSTLQR